jgi:SAM-dependent methyltransferase
VILTGERQVAPTVDGIRADHVNRYRWAASRLNPGSWVIDVACGIGYGAKVMADAGHIVLGVDRDEDAIRYGNKFHAHPLVRLKVGDANALELPSARDAAVCFETVEHLEDPRPLLRSLHNIAPMLLASVPNEDVIPFGPGFAYHFRHYTKQQFEDLLVECGWSVIEWWGQDDHESGVEPDNIDGRTLIAVAQRIGEPSVKLDKETVDSLADHQQAPVKGESGEFTRVDWPVPEHVSILGLGPSLEQYVDFTKRLGSRFKYCDQVWAINAVGGTIQHDVVFHMDDVRVQEVRAQAAPDSNIAAMLDWMKTHPGPIITSRAHPDYPGLVEYPLEDVLNEFKFAYFNSTCAYAVAFAIWLGVKKISMFGCDFTYPNSHQAEKGRACVEFWLGIAASRGIMITVPQNSTLMDAIHTQQERLYGYDTVDLTLRLDDKGYCHVDKVEKDMLPTAEEIEARYDHSAHPNTLVEAAATEGRVSER